MVQGRCFKILLSKATVKPGDRCLDIGCSTGNATAIVAKKIGTNGQVLGIDLNKHRIKIAQRKNSYKKLKFLEGTLFEIDLEESLFDLVFCNIVYHWLSEDKRLKTAAKVFPILKRNVLFLLSFRIEQVQNVKIMLRPVVRKNCNSIYKTQIHIDPTSIILIYSQAQVMSDKVTILFIALRRP